MPSPRALSLVGFVLLVAAMIFLLQTRQLIAVYIFGQAAQIAAALLMIWARITFGRRSFHPAADPTDGELITSGPYAFVRHPIYASILLFVGGTAVDHLSTIALLAFVVSVAGVLARVVAEEQLLRQRYAAYANYAQRTKRLLPFIY